MLSLKFWCSLKSSLQGNEVLIQIDYSENYANQNQNEIQSAYFGQLFFDIHGMFLFSNRWSFAKRKHNCDF